MEMRKAYTTQTSNSGATGRDYNSPPSSRVTANVPFQTLQLRIQCLLLVRLPGGLEIDQVGAGRLNQEIVSVHISMEDSQRV